MKYLTASQLARYSRGVNPDAEARCPVVSHYLCNDEEVRARVAVSETATIEITIPLEVFNGLSQEKA